VSTVPVLTSNDRLLAAVRLGLAIACGGLLLAAQRDTPEVLAAAALLLLAIAASVPFPLPALRRVQPPVEAVLACLVMLALEPLPEPLLPYLVAPALAAGLFGGVQAAVMTSGLAGLTLLLGRLLGEETLDRNDYFSAIAQWTLIPLAVGLLAAWIHRLQQRGTQREDATLRTPRRTASSRSCGPSPGSCPAVSTRSPSASSCCSTCSRSCRSTGERCTSGRPAAG
jgi:hypothetical protein